MTDQQADDFEQLNRFNRQMNKWSELPRDTWSIHALIGEPTATIDDGGGHTNRGSRPGSKGPWNQQAANLFFDIHAEIRRIESLLTLELDHRAVYRGGSDKDTQAIFERLPILLRAVFDRDPESSILDEALTGLLRLAKRAHVSLHPEDRRTRAPWVQCHLCGGDIWIYSEGHEVNPKIQSDHFAPGDAYCNRCAVFYPQDIWQRVAKENAHAS